MNLVPVYRDVILSLEAARAGSPLWPAFAQIAYHPNRPYFDGLMDTYGPEMFGSGGLPGTVATAAPRLAEALRPAPTYRMEERATALLNAIAPYLPGPPPDLYLATLFFMAPAATISVKGEPVIALGLERFCSRPPASEPKVWYHPDEIVEIIPHEAAHAVRMRTLGLPPTPRQLSLLDMVMLEGTALLFTDLLTGRESLTTFMPAEQMAWHRQHDPWVRAQVAAEFPTHGMDAFVRFFSAGSPVSGYYVGYSLCREYIDRFGPAAMAELLVLPSYHILQRLASYESRRPTTSRSD